MQTTVCKEMNSAKNASFADHNGILWFGGTNGITYFNPQEITNPAKKMERTHHRLLSARPAHKERNVVGRKRNHKHLRL